MNFPHLKMVFLSAGSTLLAKLARITDLLASGEWDTCEIEWLLEVSVMGMDFGLHSSMRGLDESWSLIIIIVVDCASFLGESTSLQLEKDELQFSSFFSGETIFCLVGETITWLACLFLSGRVRLSRLNIKSDETFTGGEREWTVATGGWEEGEVKDIKLELDKLRMTWHCFCLLAVADSMDSIRALTDSWLAGPR